MKKVLFIVGSLRKESFNRQLAEKAEKLMAEKAEVAYLNYSDVPFMNQDVEFPAPESVKRAREEVINADALWFFTPEYNYSYPGVLKNLLDWLSRPLTPGGAREKSAIAGKSAAISSAAGRSGGAGARTKLGELLECIFVNPIECEQTGVAMSAETFRTGSLVLNPEQQASLKAQAEALLKAAEE